MEITHTEPNPTTTNEIKEAVIDSNMKWISWDLAIGLFGNQLRSLMFECGYDLNENGFFIKKNES